MRRSRPDILGARNRSPPMRRSSRSGACRTTPIWRAGCVVVRERYALEGFANLPQRDAALCTGLIGPGAMVDAGAEREMAAGVRARWIETVGVGEDLIVAARLGDEKRQDRAFGDHRL